MKQFVIILSLLLLVFSCNKEQKTKSEILSKNQKEIINCYNDINIIAEMPSDSILIIVNKTTLLSSNEANEYKAMALALKGIYYAHIASYEISKKQFENGLKLLNGSKADTIKAFLSNGIGNVLKNTGEYTKSFHYLFQALKIYEKVQDKEGICQANMAIGEVYFQKGNVALAKEHLLLAIKALQKNKSNPNYLSAAHLLANVYGESGDFQNALKIDNQGIRITDSIHNKKIKSSFLDNKANCFLFSNQLDSAYYYFDKCLKTDIEVGNKKQIADSYSNLGMFYVFKKEYKTAEKFALKSISLLNEIDAKPNLEKAYSILIEIYENQHDLNQIVKTQKAYLQNYKMLIDQKKEAALAEFKVVYETQKKEQLLTKNKLKLLQVENDNNRKNNTIIILFILVLFIAILGFLLYKQQKIKQSQQEQEFLLKSAIAQIETQSKLNEQRLSISRDLHDNIGAQLTFIISSIDTIKMAFDITNDKLDKKLSSISNFTQATVIELRDTIWAMNNSEIGFEDLISRIYNFIENAKIATENIAFSFHIEEGLSHKKLTSVEGMNCYRTLQEAINNALKYANASQISIEIIAVLGKTKIIIKDNGIGFNPETVAKGNGLKNMQKRMKSIDGNIEIHSNTSYGTTVILEIK